MMRTMKTMISLPQEPKMLKDTMNKMLQKRKLVGTKKKFEV